MFLHPIKIGNVEINSNIFLAPMAGISDQPFRILCKENGAGLVYTEMISSKGMFYDDDKTKRLMSINNFERPIAVQIFGSDPQIMAGIAREVSKVADIIDINMGCPAPKVVKNGDGSKLMLNLNLIDKITYEVVKASSVPVTIKIRKGWDDNHINAVEVAKIAEKNGVAAIAVHGRTREQFYSGKADWDIIKQVKKAVRIPVIGNGDIIDGKSAKAMFEYTGCDAIMIGRASNGNPWIFKEISTFLESGVSPSAPNILEKRDMILRHLDMLIDFKGEYTAVREMRKQIAWYVKGLAGATEFRNTVNKIEDVKELKRAIREWLKE